MELFCIQNKTAFMFDMFIQQVVKGWKVFFFIKKDVYQIVSFNYWIDFHTNSMVWIKCC